VKLFKTFILKWWQATIFKWGVLAAGIAIGTYLHEFFVHYLFLLVIVAVIGLAYVTYVWWNQ
jgi:hypothetical protein